MNQRELLDIINIIRDKADNGKLVVFVGTGVSRNVEGMPSWYDLIKEMTTVVGYSKCDYYKHKSLIVKLNVRVGMTMTAMNFLGYHSFFLILTKVSIIKLSKRTL